MLAYKELQGILDRTIEWERDFNDLLDVAALGLKNDQSKKIVSELKKRQDDIIEVITGIDVNNFGPAEWVKFSSDLKREELIPKKNITRQTPPDEIIAYVREYEEALKSVYQRVADRLHSEGQRDLFLSLVKLKDSQIERLSGF